MPSKLTMLIASFALLATLQWPPPALAQDEAVAASPPVVAAQSQQIQATSATSATQQAQEQQGPALFSGKALDLGVLNGYRGGADLHISDMKVDGVVGNNQAYNLVTGANVIAQGSFSGASGLPMVIQNSGNNVLIQNATILNLQMK